MSEENKIMEMPQDQWEDLMHQKHPILLKEMDMSVQHSCMAFGITIDKGWREGCEKLLDELEDLNNNPDYKFYVVANQIKEKYADFCFYWTTQFKDGTDTNEEPEKAKEMGVDAFFAIARYIICKHSAKISNSCQLCGKPSVMTNIHGWFWSLCVDCADKVKNKKQWSE